MSAPPIAYDLTRLVLGPTLPVPRGIDRVDLGYARYFFESWRGDCFGTLPLPLGIFGGAGVLSREAALCLLDTIAGMWGETGASESDSAWRFVQSRLADKASAHVQPAPPRSFRPHRTIAILAAGIQRGLKSHEALPRNTVYVNTGQLGLAFGWLTAWLRKRPDIRRVFMLHDTIPLDYPELVPPGGREMHAEMVQRTAREADGLIVTTKEVRRTVMKALAERGRTEISVVAAPLPVASVFLEDDDHVSRHLSRPYFVVVGSIEPRKNHKLLLRVWSRLVERGGEVPKLVIVGTPWRDTDGIANSVHCSPALRRSVILTAGLTSSALRRLLRGAEALLHPSLVEGFGLPIIEALALGTPVIASSQPAHWEAGGGFATYLDANDTGVWESAICAQLASRARVLGYRPWDWSQYGAVIAPFLAEVAVRPRYESMA